MSASRRAQEHFIAIERAKGLGLFAVASLRIASQFWSRSILAERTASDVWHRGSGAKILKIASVARDLRFQIRNLLGSVKFCSGPLDQV